MNSYVIVYLLGLERRYKKVYADSVQEAIDDFSRLCDLPIVLCMPLIKGDRK